MLMPASKSQMTAEERFLAFGGQRPPGFGLHNAKSADGARARAGVVYLLAQLRAKGAFEAQARLILQSCAHPLERPLEWAALMDLSNEYWLATQPLLDYVRRVGGLGPADFEDGGREFVRWVFPESASAETTSQTAKAA